MKPSDLDPRGRRAPALVSTGRAAPRRIPGPRPVDELTNAAAGELLGQGCPSDPVFDAPERRAGWPGGR